MKNATLWSAALGATLVLAACSPRSEPASSDADKVTPSVAEREIPGTDAPSDIAAVTALWRVADLRLGAALGDDGAVTENTIRSEYVPGEAIHLSLALGEIGIGSELQVSWIGPNDEVLHQESKSVEAGATHLAFTAPDTAGWAVGEYAAEVRLGDEVGGREEFQIVASLPAS